MRTGAAPSTTQTCLCCPTTTCPPSSACSFVLLSASRRKSPPSFLAKCGGLTTATSMSAHAHALQPMPAHLFDCSSCKLSCKAGQHARLYVQQRVFAIMRGAALPRCCTAPQVHRGAGAGTGLFGAHIHALRGRCTGESKIGQRHQFAAGPHTCVTCTAVTQGPVLRMENLL